MSDKVSKQLKLALDKVEAGTEPGWRAQAIDIVRRVCQAKADFFCDDIWAAGLPPTNNDKALGPIMMFAARQGWCKKTDRVRPSIRSHYSGKPVWESLLYGRAR